MKSRNKAKIFASIKRSVFVACLFGMLFGISNAQTPCGNLADQNGRWVQVPPAGKDPQALKIINTAMSLFQRSVAGFTGGQAKTYTFTADPVDVAAGKIQGFTVAMYFLQFECVKGIVKPEAATDTWLYIGFNEIPFFTGNNRLEDSFRLPNGQQMFYSQYKLQDNFKGLPRLVPFHHPNGTAVFISGSNRLPLRPVSQAELLVAYKKFYLGKKTEYLKRLEDVLAKEPADIARIDNDKQMAGREESKKALIESNNRTRETLARLKKELAACGSTIDSYLTRPIAGQPAVVGVIDEYCDPEKMFNPPKDNARQIVVFDDEYFDKTLPPAAPQFIVVYWRRGDADYVNRDGSFRFPLKREFIRKFEENFDFEALPEMLGK